MTYTNFHLVSRNDHGITITPNNGDSHMVKAGHERFKSGETVNVPAIVAFAHTKSTGDEWDLNRTAILAWINS